MNAKLSCSHREETGKNVNNRLRSSGFIPAIIYGKNLPNVSVKIQKSEYLRFKNQNQNKKIITLEYHDPSGKEIDKAVIIKDFDTDPITKQLTHFDFYEFNVNEPIRYPIPVRFIGQAAGVKLGGMLQKNYDEIEIECLPKDAINFIEIDVTHLEFNQSVHIKDLVIGNSVKILAPPEATVATVVPPLEEKAAEPVIEEVKEPEIIKKGKEKDEGAES
ncbi:MAG: 50S ribosomal protein L25 [Candidatus Wallbacteria bacterium]|nr:50S ribosomal protein L25 [Candidatus Wallbacteria bacterium]